MNPSYLRSDSWMGKSMVFILILVMGLTALTVFGLSNRPKQTVEAAGIQVEVDRQAAELAAEMPGMSALAAARQAQELDRIQAQREQEARDRLVYQQAQDEQLRLTRAINNQEIARGEQAMIRQTQIATYAIYLGVFAGTMIILLIGYTIKRYVDRMMSVPQRARPAAIGDSRRTVAPAQSRREPVIIEGQAEDIHPRRPTPGDRSSRPPFPNGATAERPSVNGRDSYATATGYIGVPTGQPVRARDRLMTVHGQLAVGKPPARGFPT